MNNLTTLSQAQSVCDPGEHIWVTIAEYPDEGTKKQRCKLCGKTRIVSADTLDD